MKRFLFLLLLVIILVCLNWFQDVFAQDLPALEQLTDAQKQRLLQAAAARRAPDNAATRYETPAEDDSAAAIALPTPDGRKDVETGQPQPSAGRSPLVPFDALRPFGLDLFASPREAAPPTDIATAEDYVLGPGDKLVVYVWGSTDKEYRLTVDREGKVFIPRVGEVTAWGQTVATFEQHLQRRLGKIYSGSHISVSLNGIRSIRIYVTGEVRRPGAYTLPSLSSLFSALYLAGGPTERGSMRDIRLMRNGKRLATVDLYRFLLHGDNSSDIRLQTGDAIFVPVAGPRVAVRGEVQRPAIYELKGGETAADLLTLAGRPTPQAYLDRVALERVRNRTEWEVLDLNLNPSAGKDMDTLVLADGDRMTVYSIFDFKTNLVAVQGHVKHPGYFERTDSSRVSDLLARAQLRPYDVYLERANLFRRHTDWRVEVIPIDLQAILNGDTTADLLLQDHDSLYVYSIADVRQEQYVYIDGEVKRPGRYRLYDSMTVADLIFLAGSYTRAAARSTAELARVDSLGNVSIIQVPLRQAADRVILQEDDRVYIRAIPQWELHRTVRLEGEVTYPGEYMLGAEDETLYDLLLRAGGFTDEAFPEGIVFERRSISRTLKGRQVSRILEHSSPLVEDSTGEYHRVILFDYDSNAVNRLVVDVPRMMATQGREGNVVLQPGDRIYVPPVPSGISVLGAVGAQGTIAFAGSRKVKDYIELAGGFTPQADKKQTRLIRADGTVLAGGGTLGKKVRRGDVIVVPTKIEKPGNFVQTLSTILTTTTGVLTTILLIESL